MNLPPIDSHELATKASIGVTGSIYSWLQMPLSTWVALATFIYMICQIVVIVPKVIDVIRKFTTKKRNK